MGTHISRKIQATQNNGSEQSSYLQREGHTNPRPDNRHDTFRVMSQGGLCVERKREVIQCQWQKSTHKRAGDRGTGTITRPHVFVFQKREFCTRPYHLGPTPSRKIASDASPNPPRNQSCPRGGGGRGKEGQDEKTFALSQVGETLICIIKGLETHIERMRKPSFTV